jgi:hypothetical protein
VKCGAFLPLFSMVSDLRSRSRRAAEWDAAGFSNRV